MIPGTYESPAPSGKPTVANTCHGSALLVTTEATIAFGGTHHFQRGTVAIDRWTSSAIRREHWPVRSGACQIRTSEERRLLDVFERFSIDVRTRILRPGAYLTDGVTAALVRRSQPDLVRTGAITVELLQAGSELPDGVKNALHVRPARTFEAVRTETLSAFEAGLAETFDIAAALNGFESRGGGVWTMGH